MRRNPRVRIAFAVGWLVYMVAMVVTVYDGIGSVIFQPFMAAISSALMVGVAFLCGFILDEPSIGRVWKKSRIPSAALVAGSILMMCFGSSLGLRQTITDAETGDKHTGLHFIVGLGCYFFLLFSITHWPIKQKNAD
jgi:hypothetical protein